MARPTFGRSVTPEWVVWAKERLKELGMAQAELSRRSKIATSTISDVLNGKQWSFDDPDSVDALSEPLGISPFPDEWHRIARHAQRDGTFQDMLEWLAIGERFAKLDPAALKRMIELMRERVEGAEMERSRDASGEVQGLPLNPDPSKKSQRKPLRPR